MPMPIPDPVEYRAEMRHIQVLTKDGEPTSLSASYKYKPEHTTLIGLAMFLLRELKPEHTWDMIKDECPVKVAVKPKSSRSARQSESGWTDKQKAYLGVE